MDVRDDERLAQHLDDRDRGADGRLEAELHAGRGGGREELRPLAGDELLVGGDDRLARAQQLAHVGAGRVEAAHHLGDDGHGGVVADGGEVGRQDALARLVRALLRRLADERSHDPEPMTRRALDLVAALDEQPVHRRADRPVAQQRDPYVNG
jgi:hypothetical protein